MSTGYPSTIISHPMMNVALKKGNPAESKTIVKGSDTLFPTGSATIHTAQVTIDEILEIAFAQRLQSDSSRVPQILGYALTTTPKALMARKSTRIIPQSMHTLLKGFGLYTQRVPQLSIFTFRSGHPSDDR
jgi:hypothetical protein